MSLLGVLLLAILQGVAEFLPISSSGHLVLAQHFLGLSSQGISLEVILHLGTLCAVLAVYAKDIAEMLGGAVRLRKSALRLIGLLALASIPAGFVGLLLKDTIESFFDSPLAVALLLAFNGLILFWGGSAAGRSNDGDRTGVAAALAAGSAQAVAVLPGISRSGSTISALLRAGVSPSGAARFSFLLSVPAVAGAGILEAVDGFPQGSPDFPLLALGFLVSFLAGLISLKLLLRVLERGGLWVFGAWCAAAGVISAVLVLSGV